MESVAAPPGATSWTLDGRTIEAPAGKVFVRGLAADLDEDGASDIVSVVEPPDGVGCELWVFPPNKKPFSAWSLPPYIPTAPGCRLLAGLSRTGPRSVTMDVSATCSTALLERAAIRNLTVLAPLKSDVIISLRVATPAPGEELTLRVDSRDRDSDGRDDVDLEISVARSGGSEPAQAHLTWLDRAAGPSQEPAEPRRSLDALATAEVARATGKNTSRLALERIHNARRLYASLCGEGGTPRVYDSEGAPFSCGDVQSFVDRLATAEASAWLTQGDTLAAIGVLARDGWYHAPVSKAVREELESKIRRGVQGIEPTEVTRLVARVPVRSGPRWSPLAFEEPESTLLVRTPAGLMRASRDGTREQPADPASGAQFWDLAVEVSPGKVWTGVEQACGHSELLATFSANVRAPLPEVLAARPGSCGKSTAPSIPPVVPLGSAGGEVSAIVAGAWIGKESRSAGLGRARSPDGSHLIAPTPLGILVLGTDKPMLWSVSELMPVDHVGDCVVANGASAIACVNDTQVILARR